GCWHGARLSGENKHMLWIPAGLAHGFAVLSEEGAHVLYKATDFHEPECERTLAWNDPHLKIDWQIQGEPIVSAKDSMGLSVSEAGEFEASLKNEMLPVELPEDAGVNVTPNDTLLPAATVVGNVMPLTE